MSRANAGVHPHTNQLLEGKEGVETRRALVLEFRLRGLKVEAIAKLLKVHRNTVTNDIKAISRRQAEVVQDLDPDASIGESIEFLDHARNEAMMAYKVAETDTGRVSFLQAAIRAQELKTRLLMDSGVIPKAGKAGATGLTLDGKEMDDDSLKKMTNADLLDYQKKLQERIAQEERALPKKESIRDN